MKGLEVGIEKDQGPGSEAECGSTIGFRGFSASDPCGRGCFLTASAAPPGHRLNHAVVTRIRGSPPVPVITCADDDADYSTAVSSE